MTGNEAEAAVTQRFPPIRAGMTLLLVSYCAVSCVLYTRVLFYVTLFQTQLQGKQQTSF